MKRWQKILLIVLLSILGVMIVSSIAIYALISHYYNKVNYVSLDDNAETIVYSIPEENESPPLDTVTDAQGNIPQSPDGDSSVTDDLKIEEDIEANKSDDYVMQFGKHIKNILLIGTDGRTDTDRGRSDTMILLSINEKTNQAVLTSFMRDIYLHIPEVNYYNRINAAYAHGGVPLLIKTIRENFKIQIDQYVQIDFTAFQYIIDTLGGVDIELTQAEIDYIGLRGQASPGIVHLNGSQALMYCRCRYVPKGNLDGDFARTERQREFLAIMSEKLKGLSLAKLNELLDLFLPQVTTNLQKSDLISLMSSSLKYLDYEFVGVCLPVDGTWKYQKIRQMSVITIDFKKNIEALEKVINGG